MSSLYKNIKKFDKYTKVELGNVLVSLLTEQGKLYKEVEHKNINIDSIINRELKLLSNQPLTNKQK